MKDLFGEEIIEDVLLRDKFLEPPFSVLDSKTGSWQARKRDWKNIGIQSEIGRDSGCINMDTKAKEKNIANYVSIFDPALTELMYKWFCPEGGKILDPFAGGSVRGIVAHYLGYKYMGIDIRPEQIESNYIQGKNILPNNVPDWVRGDSNEILDIMEEDNFDMVFSCPPYADLEVYSDLDGDISNMDYDNFLIAYKSIIKKACARLKSGGYAVFVVGEVRDKKGNYIGFVPDTINSFCNAKEMYYYNEAILLNPIASASMRADKQFTTSEKLVKIHQNVLVFRKG